MSRPTKAFSGCINLAAHSLGARALATSDDWFARVSNLLKDAEPTFDPHTYCDTGKVMDGWESRRRRSPGHDWALIALGVPGQIRGVDIDTAFFMGNHAPFARLEGCVASPDSTAASLNAAQWVELVPQSALERGSHNLFGVTNNNRFTHLRLSMYPDGGIARLRVFGVAEQKNTIERFDLAAATNGARPVGCSDMFFSPMIHLISPGDAVNMGGGWETRRRRDDGHDWIVIKLATPAILEQATIDTKHFKGNYPAAAALEGVMWPSAPDGALLKCKHWKNLLSWSRLGPDQEHSFATEHHVVSHVRLNIRPCGGVSRLRLWGHSAKAPTTAGFVSTLNEATLADRIKMLHRCCGSQRFSEQLAALAPYASEQELFGSAEWVWWHLSEGDWLQAFSHHPRIGSDVKALAEKFAPTEAWSKEEQAGVAHADTALLESLAAANVAYEERFGFIFLICATGLSAQTMLDALNDRMYNRAEDEVRFAAAEQSKITQIRMEKL